jgi:hypothetical protein
VVRNPSVSAGGELPSLGSNAKMMEQMLQLLHGGRYTSVFTYPGEPATDRATVVCNADDLPACSHQVAYATLATELAEDGSPFVMSKGHWYRVTEHNPDLAKFTKYQNAGDEDLAWGLIRSEPDLFKVKIQDESGNVKTEQLRDLADEAEIVTYRDDFFREGDSDPWFTPPPELAAKTGGQGNPNGGQQPVENPKAR